LAKTQPFWEDWFIGLSKKFLEAKGGKLLILAGTDRLDKELTIGQMQGKYQLLVLPEVGHFLHEDAPEKTAVAVGTFPRWATLLRLELMELHSLSSFTNETTEVHLFYQRKYGRCRIFRIIFRTYKNFLLI
jgi:hypothetical protein